MILRPIAWMRHLFAIAALAGCTAAAESVAPPQYSFYFPTGMAISPDERYLFVLNADADLRYSAGSLLVLDLDQVDALANAWRDSCQTPAGCDTTVAPTECSPLPDRPTILGCPTQRADGTAEPVMVAGASVQIGSFGVSLGVQPLTQGGAPTSVLRLFATVRGDPSLTWMDFDGDTGKMSCGGAAGFPRCDETHRLARIHNDATLSVLPIEPFDVAVDAPNQHVFVTHLTTGQVTLASAPSEIGSAPVLEDTLTSIFGVSVVGTLGAVGIAPRLPGDPLGLIYVTSRTEARVAMLHAVPGPPLADGTPTEVLVRSGDFFYDGLSQSGLLADARNLTFSADGDRAYIVSRSPPAIKVYDTSLDATGAPVNAQLSTTEVCGQPSNLVLADFGLGMRVAVPCFANGQVWIVDPAQAVLVAAEDTGRGPNGIAASPKRKKIYVGNYAEDTVMVIDETPGLRSLHHSVLRLGTERPAGLQ